MRIENQLPPDLLAHYDAGVVHKATKKGKSTIVVQTRDKRQEVWKKHGGRWLLEQPHPAQRTGGEGWFTKSVEKARGRRTN